MKTNNIYDLKTSGDSTTSNMDFMIMYKNYITAASRLCLRTTLLLPT